ncbi:MAG: hydantoinase B/oxoprolinase family protein, partial [Alphaproteobacteria bacterium]|nr:hydantoinase B/oxoprolinase family protein [Alphaproteobacteria bacterium]
DRTVMHKAFEAAHLQRFGFISPEKAVVIATLEVEATGGGSHLDEPDRVPQDIRSIDPAKSFDRITFYSGGAHHQANAYRRKDLRTGDCISGPAFVIEDHQTVVIEAGWSATLSSGNSLVLRRSVARKTRRISSTRDPVLLEVFNNHFMAIAEQMGAALANTAQSINIKERLDFSCAVFDREGNLVANAPHVPVHLGSMDRSVATIIKKRQGRMAPGDVYMLNAPYDGGTHLPDITVITPVFDTANQTIDFFVASRGHHADIGGITPGSMSPKATSIEQEGVVIDNFLLVRDGRFREADVLQLLQNAPYPARNPAQNIADLKAQVAANARGARDLANMVQQFGPEVVQTYMKHVQDNAEEAVRRLLSRLQDGRFRVETDDGIVINVAVTIDYVKRSARIDFTGTSPQQPNNFNAPEPVTRAAVLYVMRVLLEENIPINAGCMRPLQIVIPPGSVLSPRFPAAVVAGNVETSQIITNALFAAFGALAASQGTMNNLTFGDSTLQYYETICSGSPAGPGFNGTAGVQVHMTNTRLTDPEVLELRYPVVVDDFSICRGSGGAGQWSAGDGIRRSIRFLKPMMCTILSGFRKTAPFGLAGGKPGKVGRNSIRRTNGHIEQLEGCAEAQLNAGDSIVIETPTGGGFGPPSKSDR